MKKKIPQDTYCFIYENMNPKQKITGDCVIRALARAMDKTWDDILTDLYNYSMKYKQMLDCPQLYSKYLKDQGWIKIKQPRKFDNTKYTGKEFCKELNEGTCLNVYGYEVTEWTDIIAHIGGHHTIAIIEGKIRDTWDSSDGCIGNIWIKNNR